MAYILVYDYKLNVNLKNTMNLLVHSSLYWLVPTGELRESPSLGLLPDTDIRWERPQLTSPTTPS